MKTITTGVQIDWTIEVPDEMDEDEAIKIANDCLEFEIKQPKTGRLVNEDGNLQTWWM